MILLFDVGNTHTHLGLADAQRVRVQANLPTARWEEGSAEALVRKLIPTTPGPYQGRRSATGFDALEGAVICSVVPRATPLIKTLLRSWKIKTVELTPQTVWGIGIDYPKPETIGPDRLANAIAVRHRYGAPAVVVDFGTAVTFDVVDRKGNYAGGIIAPGLAAMTEYLHEKTALLPRIQIRDVRAVIGKSTKQAMLIGAVHGYRGLVRELIKELRGALDCRRLPVVATGGYAELISANVPEITAVEPLLTLEGLRLVWESQNSKGSKVGKTR